MQMPAYLESTSGAIVSRRVVLMTRSAFGSSSAMCTLEPELTARNTPTRSMGALRPAMTAPRPVYQRPKSDSELVTSLHDRSGLTWEQLARAIGVSRRSLHMWAAGSTVTYAHRRIMERFELLITSIGMTPVETRVKLLEQRPGRGSLLDDFRRDRNGEKREINGPALGAFEML